MSTALLLLELAPPHDRWPARAERDMGRVRRALGPGCHAVHHVGSTSVPGLHAVPVIDLVAELRDGLVAETAGLRLMVHGFLAAAAEPSCSLHIVEDALTGHRQVELRCYPAGHRDVQVLLAFYALLRATPAAAAAYDGMKRDARARHGAGSPGYHDAKQAWMRRHDSGGHDFGGNDSGA